jgi:FixJ family two-component response regulator
MGERGTVVVVEDDDDVREALAWFLRGVGFEVREHGDPVDFLSAPRPVVAHCVLLDLRLPGVGGIEVLERLRDRGDTTPVILITGHGSTGAAHDALSRGAVAFFEKPVDHHELVARLDGALAARRAATAGAVEPGESTQGKPLLQEGKHGLPPSPRRENCGAERERSWRR